MGTRVVTECDRCGQEIPDSEVVTKIKIDDEFDLCPDCGEKLKFWMNNPSGPPPGYRWQQRKCHCHVPCADPNAHGEELVPI
jgi:hypothetical protein